MSPWAKWLKPNFDLAGLTGQDARALAAFHHVWEMYAVSDGNGASAALLAAAALCGSIQPKFLDAARELIAFSLDWSDRDRLWAKVVAKLGFLAHNGEASLTIYGIVKDMPPARPR